jgi:hypothetical protein
MGLMSAAWENWERLRTDPEADPIEVSTAVSAFQRNFAGIEKEAVKVARSQNRIWLRTRKIASGPVATGGLPSRRVEGCGVARSGSTVGRLWATSAEVRHKMGMSPP